MDTLVNLIPPKYLPAIVIVLAAIKLLDLLVCAIPDKWVSAHSTVAAIVNAVKWVYGRTKDAKVPGPAIVLLLALGLSGCATAGGHYAYIPPDPVKCSRAAAAAGVQATIDQLPCDKSKPDPLSCLQGVRQGLIDADAALTACLPTPVWTPDAPAK